MITTKSIEWEKVSLIDMQNVVKSCWNEKYSALNRDNLTISIQMQLSQKQKTFSNFLAAFLKSSLNFEYFEKNITRVDFFYSEITDSETVMSKMSKKCLFRGPFNKQYGKPAKALSK